MRLMNPVLGRDLMMSLRRPWAFGLLLGLLVCLLVVATFASESTTYDPTGRIAFPDPALFSRRLFLTGGYLQITLFSILALVFAGRRISIERARKTIDLLLTTPLRPVDVVLGKALASVAYLLLLAFATLPFYALSLVLGGVGWNEIVALLHITVVATVTYAVVGVATSAMPFASRAVGSALGFGVFLLLNGGLALLLGLFGTTVGLPDTGVEEVAWMGLLLASPVGALHGISGGGEAPTWAVSAAYLLGYTLVQVVVISLFVWLGCKGVCSEVVLTNPHGRARRPIDEAEKPEPSSRLRLFPIPDQFNPVAAKEVTLFVPALRRRRAAYGAAGGVLLLLGIWFIVAADLDVDAADRVFVFAALAFVLFGGLVAYFRAAGVVAAEIDNKTVELLASTPTEAIEILRGKLQAVVTSTSVVIGTGGLALAAVYFSWHPVSAVVMVLGVPALLLALVAGAAMYGGLGIRISAGARSARVAVNRAAVALVVLLIAIGFFGLALSFSTGGVVFLTLAAVVLCPPSLMLLIGSGGLPAFCLLFPVGIVICPLVAQFALKSAAGAFTRNLTEESEMFAGA